MTIIHKRPLLNKLVADRQFEIPIICPGYIVSVYVYGRLVATTAHGIILGPLCVWVCEEICI